jgi:hypothetical protein
VILCFLGVLHFVDGRWSSLNGLERVEMVLGHSTDLVFFFVGEKYRLRGTRYLRL